MPYLYDINSRFEDNYQKKNFPKMGGKVEKIFFCLFSILIILIIKYILLRHNLTFENYLIFYNTFKVNNKFMSYEYLNFILYVDIN